VLARILELLPENPPFFDKDQFTDRSERFFMQEFIREKILLAYQKEVPYSVEIEVESFKEMEEIIHIEAVIYVSRESQKGIIIGKEGKMLKRVGSEARADAEEFFGKKIFLKLFVKVAKDWRNKDRALKNFGYDAY
jgi:GTP-binding protein Era